MLLSFWSSRLYSHFFHDKEVLKMKQIIVLIATILLGLTLSSTISGLGTPVQSAVGNTVTSMGAVLNVPTT